MSSRHARCGVRVEGRTKCASVQFGKRRKEPDEPEDPGRRTARAQQQSWPSCGVSRCITEGLAGEGMFSRNAESDEETGQEHDEHGEQRECVAADDLPYHAQMLGSRLNTGRNGCYGGAHGLSVAPLGGLLSDRLEGMLMVLQGSLFGLLYPNIGGTSGTLGTC
jgi:hypothetical protein